MYPAEILYAVDAKQLQDAKDLFHSLTHTCVLANRLRMSAEQEPITLESFGYRVNGKETETQSKEMEEARIKSVENIPTLSKEELHELIKGLKK